MRAVKRLGLIAAGAALVASGLLPAGVRADEVQLSAVCGVGYGGSYLGPYYTSYTQSSSCYHKYLSYTFYVSGTPYVGGSGWTNYNQSGDINPFASSIAGSHRLCNDTMTICSNWGGSSDT